MCAFPNESCHSQPNVLIIIEAIPLCVFDEGDGAGLAAPGSGSEACGLCREGRLPARRIATLSCDEAASLVEGVGHVEF